LNYLEVEKKNISLKQLWLYIGFTYFISVVSRFILYFQASDIAPIWTPDAGLYGFYAKQLITGISLPFDNHYIAGYFIYFIHNITTIDIDNLMFYLPAFLSSLVVIPIMFLTYLYKIPYIGIFSAILGSTWLSYYSRTHLGYMDTDVLNSFFILSFIVSIIWFSEKKDILSFSLAILSLFAFFLWYHSSLPIIAGFISFYLLYFFIFDNSSLKIKMILFSSCLVILSIFLYKYDFSIFYDRAVDYINKQDIFSIGEYKFKSSLSTVSEAQSQDIFMVAKNMVGSFYYLFFATLGLILLAIKNRSAILLFFMLFLGLISIVAGFRFSIYGVQVASIGLIFFLAIFKNVMIYFANFNKKTTKYILNIILTILCILPVLQIVNYNKHLSPFFTTKESNVLKNLEEDAFVLSWWDYGWPIWYYTNNDKSTLIDNGKHHEDNYIVSKILTSNNQTFIANASKYFSDRYIEFSPKSIISFEIAKNNLSILNILSEKDYSYKAKQPTYILLHKKMLLLFSTIYDFSNLDLNSGKRNKEYVFYLNKIIIENEKTIVTLDMIFDIENGFIYQNDIKFPIKSFNEKKFHEDGFFVLKDKGVIYIMGEDILNSFIFQTLLFKNIDSEKFEIYKEVDNILLIKVK
jgi:dolichyl-diphosphooligosaccharide--protein glycosyltransferase/undecaprenyl-diphosphooligosaccharide--protein glycosyltransferase